MNDELTARNFGARPGHKLYDDIGLPGWDERSVGGNDEGVGSFYAQLWRNPGDSDAPDVWLSDVDPCYPWPEFVDVQYACDLCEQSLDGGSCRRCAGGQEVGRGLAGRVNA